MTRFENWPVLLDAFVEEHRATPFSWHAWDCCFMAAAWVLRATGVDLFAQYAERYAPTMPSALRIVHEAGGLKPLVDAALAASIAPAFAQRGDIVLVDIDGRESLAVCLGREAAGAGVDGMVFVERGMWACAWRV